MKKKILFFIACLSLLTVNFLLMNVASATIVPTDEEMVDTDSYFADDANAPNPLMYDEEGNIIENNPGMPVATSSINNEIDQSLDRDLDEEDEVSTQASSADEEIISGSAPMYPQN